MLWRYHIFILLVGVPGCRIFSTSAIQTDNERRALPLSDEELVDILVKQLSHSESGASDAKEAAKVVLGSGQTNYPSKKDTQNEKGKELNLEAQEPGGPQPSNNEGSETSSSPVSGGHAAPGQHSALQHQPHHEDEEESSRILSKEDTKFAIFVGAGLAAGFIGIMVAGVCYYKFRRSAKAASDIGYPAYGVTGPMKEKIPSPGDRKLAQSAQMYHYQHQKQQMIAMEKANGDMKHDASEDESEEDNVEGDYTVYECPGLAPTGEMEVKNPLFCGEEAPPPPPSAHQDPEYASTDVGQGQEHPSSPSQGHRNP